MVCRKKLIPTSKDQILVHPEEIIYSRANNRSAILILKDNSEHHISLTLKELCSLMNCEYLIRTHHSYVVNLNHIIKVKGAFEKLQLTNNTEIPVSRRKRSEVRKIITGNLENESNNW
jgi:two-component system LytT family response regulator